MPKLAILLLPLLLSSCNDEYWFGDPSDEDAAAAPDPDPPDSPDPSPPDGDVIIYGVAASSPDLLAIDLAAGEVTELGSFASNRDLDRAPTALAVRTSDALLFVWMAPRQGLLSVDPCTVEGNAITPSSEPQGIMSGLAFLPGGRLLGAGQAGRQGLFEIDTATGRAEFIGPIVLGTTSFLLAGLDVHPDGRLLGVHDSAPFEILTIDPDTGAVTDTTSMQVPPAGLTLGSIAFDPSDGTPYLSLFWLTTGPSLGRIEAEGDVVELEEVPLETPLSGLAFAPACP